MALWLHSKWGNTVINTRNYKDIRKREITAYHWNQVGNPAEGLLGESTASSIDDSDPRASEWLYNSAKWNKSFPAGWEPIRVLGAGGFGIAGHWRYVAEGPHKMGFVQGEIHDIVVKQASAVINKGLINEAFIMEMLTRTGSRHFPQIYGRVHRDVGHQDRVFIDQKRREVHRIFMEYCERGSVGTYINEAAYRGDPIPEAVLWSWFHCFAKAAVAMERGHEQDADSRVSRREPWGHGREIVHYDIKPDNALVTVCDENEHIGARRVVISDFGVSQVLPNERYGRHRDHDKILNENENIGTVMFRAPEQQREIPRHLRQFGACTNIFQIGCLMYCLMMLTNRFPDYICPTYTRLTGTHRSRGGEALETLDHLSRSLRGLVAECLFMDPAYRPTAMELLWRTRDGLRRVNPWGAMASKLYERLKPVDTLMLDRWFEKEPSVVWPQRIPEMEEVVNLRRQQERQVVLAQNYIPQNGTGQGANPPGGPATRQVPPTTGNQGGNPPAGPAAGQNPPGNNNQAGAPPVAGPSGTAEAQPPPTRTEPVVRHKPWPGDKFTKPIDILDDKAPRKLRRPPAGNAPPKQPDWGKVAKNIKCPPPANVPRPQKRPSKEKGPDPKRVRQAAPAPMRQMDMVNNWLRAVDLNRRGTPVPQLAKADQTFLMPVRVWPGPLPTAADESQASFRTFVIPIGATLADLLKVMKAESGSVARAVRCTFARGGMTTELPMSTTLAKLGYGPAPRVRTAHLECFRVMFVPLPYGPEGIRWSFNLVVYMPSEYTSGPGPQLTLKAGFQMTILQIKQVIVDSDMCWYFKSPSQMKIYCEGPDPQAHDCPDHRLILSFFKDDDPTKVFVREGELVKLFCVFRPVGQGGSGSGRVAGFNRVYTPPRHRSHRRFL